MRPVLIATAVGAIAVAAPAAAAGAPPGAITICHGVGGASLVPLSIAPQSVINGHAGRHPRDIIPPFDYGQDGSFPGQNWNQTGILTWLNACRSWTPPEPPEPPVPPPPRPVPPPAPPPVAPVINIAPVTFCLARDTGYVVRTEKPLTVARLIIANPTSIVPPFSFTVNDRAYAYPGYNWGVQGQAVWDNGCVVPTAPPLVTPGGGAVAPDPDASARVAVVITPSTYRPRPGAVVRFTVRGSAGGSEEAIDPRMCARVPRMMRVVRTVNGVQRAQTVCWLSGLTGQGVSTRYFTARVDPRAAGILINARAAIDASNTRPARSLTTLYPTAGSPPVTG